MKNLKIISLILSFALLIGCSSDDDISENNDSIKLEADRIALIAIYDANTDNTLAWDITTTDVSTWEGIIVENNRVAVLSIVDKGIDNIPASALATLTELRNIVAAANNISSINVENNVKLANLQLFNNELTTIDVSKNILLEQLLLEGNNMEELDVSMLTVLTDLKAGGNNFNNTVNIANGNNSNMWRMEISGGSLSCIQVDTGATNGFDGWSKSDNATYNTTCP